ncbi:MULTISPECIES: hypothetical protein [Aliivibrio]|uniref:hypothetical protein n=1 Tax=Aliivibrio TaxID=511678 RepID=UPI001A932DA5|nr:MULTISPECIES: hypothetical protein [Aliivibrio]MDD9177582.1 hypothetical protein [Aliivibrio sp. A6]
MSLVHSDISKGQVKHLDGINKNAEKIKAYLIGQIGKNFSVEPNKITLELILDEVYAIINEAKALIGGRAVILECDKNPKLIELYKENGFDELIHTPSESLVTMYTYIA